MGGRSILVLFLVCVLILIRAEARLGKQEEEKKQPIATIHVINAMPNGSQPMLVRCSSRFTDHGMQGVQAGEDYQCGVEEKALYYCEALWGRYIASWHAFQPRRDGTHKAVFWLVKSQGFFHSWDNSTWVKKSQWETE